MKKTITIHKNLGETPFFALEKLKRKMGWHDNTKLCYAGRLDPMAEGKLLVLINDECKKQSNYHSLDKGYEFEILVGANTDTGDVLGLIDSTKIPTSIIENRLIAEIAKNMTGNIDLPYPVFSSKTVKGKPLFLWKLENKINEIEIPKAKTEIYKFKLISSKTIKKEGLHNLISQKINSLQHINRPSMALGKNFRKEDILQKWNLFFEKLPQTTSFQILKFYCVCSSGTYIRSIANTIGEKLDYPCIAFSINRTNIGKYFKITNSLGFWIKSY